MKILSRFVLSFFANTTALWGASAFIEGFRLNPAPEEMLKAVLLFTLINLLLSPFLKLILSPLIIVTFGAGIILVNTLLLFILDFVIPALIIEKGFWPLFLAGFCVTVANFLLTVAARSLYRP